MRKRSSISLGPGAPSLILIFVVLSMAVLGVLSLMTARNDVKLSERSAEVIEAVYQLNCAAEERAQTLSELVKTCAEANPAEDAFYAALEAGLPEEVQLEDGLLVWEENDGFRILDCALEADPAGRTAWRRHNLSSATAEFSDFDF